MNKNSVLILSLFLITFFTSCVSSKRLNYFDDITSKNQSLDSTNLFKIHRIKTNDRLNIVVSSYDPALTAFLNPNSINNSSTNVNNNIGGYLVDQSGTIEFPLLSKVHVEGLTTNEVSTLLKEKLSYYYKDLYISVNLLGNVYFITSKGGGELQLKNQRMTIFEAIAQMPPTDPLDQKNKVWLIREDSGKRIFTKLDLNSKTIFLLLCLPTCLIIFDLLVVGV